MRLDRTEVIAGQPIKRVRDWLRNMRSGEEWTRSSIAAHFGLSDPEELIIELRRRQLLTEAQGRQKQTYKWGPLAGRFSAAKLLHPISRKRADELVQGLLERIMAVNENPDLLMSVVEARIFGSYLDSSCDQLSDVDVAIRLESRLPLDDFTVASVNRARASGKSIIDQYGYAEREVTLFLKSRKGHLSLHYFDELERMGQVQTRLLYPADGIIRGQDPQT